MSPAPGLQQASLSEATLRVGVVGCGHMGALHARRLQQTPGVTLVGVVDPKGVPQDLPGCVDLPALDAVVIATPPDTHLQLTLPWLERGVACLVEKPLAHCISDALALAAFPRLSVNHLERYNPAIRALPSDLRPRYFKAQRMGSFQTRGSEVDVVLDLMVHDLDLLGWLCNKHAPDLLRGVGLPVRTQGVDIVEAWLELGDCVASLSASRVSPAPVRELRLVDGEHYYSLDLRAGTAKRLAYGQPDALPELLPSPKGDALGELHRLFLRAVAGQGPFPVPGAEGARAVHWAQQVSQASRRGT